MSGFKSHPQPIGASCTRIATKPRKTHSALSTESWRVRMGGLARIQTILDTGYDAKGDLMNAFNSAKQSEYYLAQRSVIYLFSSFD